MKTKKQQVFQHLLRGKSITPKEALERYGSYRLGAIIHELRQEGYPIHTTLVQAGRSHYAEYKLIA